MQTIKEFFSLNTWCTRQLLYHHRFKRWKFRLTKNDRPLNKVIHSVCQAWTFHFSCKEHFAELNFRHSIFDPICRSNDMIVVVQCACFSSFIDPIESCEEENQTPPHLFELTSSHLWSPKLRLQYHLLSPTKSFLRSTSSSQELISHPNNILQLFASAVSFAVDNGMRVNWSDWSWVYDPAVLLFQGTDSWQISFALTVFFPRRKWEWLIWTPSMGSAHNSRSYTGYKPLKITANDFSSKIRFQCSFDLHK